MNIAIFLEQQFDPNAGGVQRSTSKLASIFKDKGHHVIIISSSQNLPQMPIWNGISISNINMKTDSVVLKQIVEREAVSVLINQAGYSLRITKFLKQNLNSNIKIINTLRINPLNFYDNHEFFIENILRHRGLAIFNKSFIHKIILKYHIAKQSKELNYIVKNTDAFVMLSEHFIPELYFLSPVLKKYDYKIHGIGNPFERPEINITSLEKENIFLFVGRLDIIQKRVDLLMEIWKRLHAECPDWRFWVLGDGESKTFMQDYCKEHQLDRVIFFGKDNPNNYYLKAKIFHMTSAFEGFGNVLVEAQSYGCVPFLFNSYSAAQDIVNHNEDGILIEPFDVEDYFNQTIALINHPSKLKQLSVKAFENMTKFSFENTYKKWVTVFSSLNKNYKI
ncbi:glycosyltransferase [Gelidibacter japonicus]|uniref:glycosyltransferase n=1 Tax=Gelidibacter japonicus TaxID=1962232 RepID=UPI002B003CF6|nr:glycosyltransferase [Gelidibacter japonicus]